LFDLPHPNPLPEERAFTFAAALRIDANFPSSRRDFREMPPKTGLFDEIFPSFVNLDGLVVNFSHLFVISRVSFVKLRPPFVVLTAQFVKILSLFVNLAAPSVNSLWRFVISRTLFVKKITLFVVLAVRFVNLMARFVKFIRQTQFTRRRLVV
jgi:hypothetical protein